MVGAEESDWKGPELLGCARGDVPNGNTPLDAGNFLATSAKVGPGTLDEVPKPKLALAATGTTVAAFGMDPKLEPLVAPEGC